MDFYSRIDLNLAALAVCAVMFITSLRDNEKHLLHNRLFRALILSTALMLTLEATCWVFEGHAGSLALLINYSEEMLIYLFTPLPPLIWALYVHYQLLHDMRKLNLAVVVLSIPVAVSALITLSTPCTGAMFTISSANVYQRGPFFPLMAAISFMPIIYSFIQCIVYNRRISRYMLMPLCLFALPPVIGAVLQIMFYGTTLIWSSITISIFIIHASVQNRQYDLDHLTGVFSRRPLDNVLHDRITAAQTGRRFACIMLDIDNFKHINDTYGHVMGDEALKDTATILRSCIRSGDFLARYAGDEFVIVMDAACPDAPRQVLERIRQASDAFNHTGKPYTLSFSSGAAIYEPASGLDRFGFLEHVDRLMYQEKKTKKAFPAFFPVHG